VQKRCRKEAETGRKAHKTGLNLTQAGITDINPHPGGITDINHPERHTGIYTP